MSDMSLPASIGIFGGTFDPIHFGHLNLAVAVYEVCGLKEVWFCPTRQNPLKAQEPLTSIEHRLKMVELALEDLPTFRLENVEALQPKCAYTVDLLRFLIQREKERGGERSFGLILGNDTLENFLQWKEPGEIVSLVSVLIGRRTSNPVSFDPLKRKREVYEGMKKHVVNHPVLEISSTQIRTRMAQGRYCGHLLPKKVLDYINKHKLYYSHGS